MTLVGATVIPCPRSEQQVATHWLAFELVGEDDQPVPWEQYLVIFPDGTRVSGYLDENGSARLEGIAQEGVCRVGFPELDGEAWEELELE